MSVESETAEAVIAYADKVKELYEYFAEFKIEHEAVIKIYNSETYAHIASLSSALKALDMLLRTVATNIAPPPVMIPVMIVPPNGNQSD